jgi:hypothetical protein
MTLPDLKIKIMRISPSNVLYTLHCIHRARWCNGNDLDLYSVNRMILEENSIFLEVIVSVIVREKKVYMNLRLI